MNKNPNEPRNDSLDWTAYQFLEGLLDENEQDQFETQLTSDPDAQAALARAVEISDELAALAVDASVPSYPVPSNPVPSNPVPSNPVPSNPVAQPSTTSADSKITNAESEWTERVGPANSSTADRWLDGARKNWKVAAIASWALTCCLLVALGFRWGLFTSESTPGDTNQTVDRSEFSEVDQEIAFAWAVDHQPLSGFENNDAGESFDDEQFMESVLSRWPNLINPDGTDDQSANNDDDSEEVDWMVAALEGLSIDDELIESTLDQEQMQ